MATNINDLPYNTTTELPQRDIPRETIEHAADPQITQTYTQPKQPDYIEHQQVQLSTPSKLDRFLEEFRMPILVSILYILFNLPIVQSSLEKMAPSLFMESSTSILSKGLLFGSLYYSSLVLSDYLNKP
jgi:hypothetical protein